MGTYKCLWVSGCLYYRCIWVFMGIYEFLWIFMGFYGCLWVSKCLWVFMGVHGSIEAFMDVYGYLSVAWVSMSIIFKHLKYCLFSYSRIPENLKTPINVWNHTWVIKNSVCTTGKRDFIDSYVISTPIRLLLRTRLRLVRARLWLVLQMHRCTLVNKVASLPVGA